MKNYLSEFTAELIKAGFTQVFASKIAESILYPDENWDNDEQLQKNYLLAVKKAIQVTLIKTN